MQCESQFIKPELRSLRYLFALLPQSTCKVREDYQDLESCAWLLRLWVDEAGWWGWVVDDDDDDDDEEEDEEKHKKKTG